MWEHTLPLMQNEYLEILGLSPGATEKEIKAAYRNLAKKYHPDISKDKHAKTQFIKATEAYKFLTDVGPKPNQEFVDYNYDPHTTEYDERRERAKTYARQKAEEESAYQQSLLNKLYFYFNFFGIFVILFNLLLIVDYYLPEEKHRKDIISATEVYFYPSSGGRIHQYDRLTFLDFELKFSKGKINNIASPIAFIYTTPIFNSAKKVQLQLKTGVEFIKPLNNLYKILIYLIPAVMVFIGIYFMLKNRHYNKNTFAIAFTILFLIEVFMIIRHSI